MAANPTDDAEPHDTGFEDLMKPRNRFPQELVGNVPAQQGNHKFPCDGALLRPKAPENPISSYGAEGASAGKFIFQLFVSQQTTYGIYGVSVVFQSNVEA